MSTGQLPAKAASIRDVARVAGVSYQTVSRVLNDHSNVRPSTRQRVLDAVDQLDFHPNRAARMLATSRSHTIGAVAAALGGHHGPTSIIAAFENAARSHGYTTLLASPRDLDPDSLHEAVLDLVHQGVEGIAAIAPHAKSAEAIMATRTRIPIVLLQSHHHDVDGLAVDNSFGARLAAEHLTSLGYRRLGMITGPLGWAEAEARQAGFRDALHDSGASLAVVVEGDWSADSGYAAFGAIHRADVHAVFCSNDQMALGFIHAASEAGLRVPSDVSVVGFDDVPEAAHFLPPLTTIRQDFELIGRRAVSALIGRLSGEDPGFAGPLAPELILRASTSPAAATAQP